MSEVLKTLGFVCVAAVVVGVAWLGRPTPPVSDTEDLQGQRLFPDFTDPLAATSMEIVEYDPAMAQVRPFTVAQVDVKGEGKPRWSIPTHENYPADAQDQVADAAGSVIGLKILDVVTDKAGEHENYGVVDPDPKNRKGSTGVGTRVTMRDSHGKVLMSLIVGKEVSDRPGLRYVRKTDQDPVYIVQLATDKLSAKFSDWIEKDLLKLNAWDIKQIRIRDHSVDEMNMALLQRSDTTVAYDDTAETQWRLVKDAMFGGGKWFSVPTRPGRGTRHGQARRNEGRVGRPADCRRRPQAAGTQRRPEGRRRLRQQPRGGRIAGRSRFLPRPDGRPRATVLQRGRGPLPNEGRR